MPALFFMPEQVRVSELFGQPNAFTDAVLCQLILTISYLVRRLDEVLSIISLLQRTSIVAILKLMRKWLSINMCSIE